MGVNSLTKTVTRQRRGCDLNPAPSVPESSTLTTQLPSHPQTGHVYTIHTLMASRSRSLQSSVNTVHPGLLSRNACAAGSSFSTAHRDSAIPDWWKPSDRPQQPITDSRVTMQWPISNQRDCTLFSNAEWWTVRALNSRFKDHGFNLGHSFHETTLDKFFKCTCLHHAFTSNHFLTHANTIWESFPACKNWQAPIK